MPRKYLAMIVLIAALVLSTTAVSASGPAPQVDLKAQAAALLAQKYGIPAESLRQVGRAPAVRFPMQGLAVREFKFIDSQGGSYGIAVNTAGQEVDMAVLHEAEKQAREARFGKLDPQLQRALAAAGAQDRIEVEIWLNTPDGPAEARMQRPAVDGSRADAGKDVDAAALEMAEAASGEAAMARAAGITAPFVQELQAAGLKASANAMAPLVNVSMPVEMIRQYAHRPEVEMIYAASRPGNELDIARKAVGAQFVNSAGITGAGSKVAVVEFAGTIPLNNPYLAGTTRDTTYACPVTNHATGIAGIIRSTHATYKGIAAGTSLWFGCGNTDAELQDLTNRANAWGADTYNLSWYSGTNHTPGVQDRFYDTVMFDFTDLVVKSAGNRGSLDGWITPPGLGYNTLTVGNFDDMDTVSAGDDVMNPTSSWKDPLSAHGDREKPEVVAPGTDINSTRAASPWVGSVGSGTSFSAPMVSGTTSLMYQRNASLRAWPESTKAIIMATALRNKEGNSRLSNKDGAGGLWALEADWVARNNTTHGRWGGDEYDCTSATPTAWDITSMTLTAGHKTRVVLVWDQNPNYAFYPTQPSADLDIQIWKTSSPLEKDPAAASYSWDNTYEIVDFVPATTGTYALRINKFRCELTPGYIGWAWWTRP